LVDPTSNPVPVYGISASLGVIDTVLIKSEQKTVPYEGKVYCFEVPNHLFITRRNGKIGIHGNTHSTSKNARQVSEEQLFIPERIHTDEIIQGELVVRELGVTMWEYKSLGPRIVGAEEISAGVSSFANAGAFSINHAIERANEAFGLSMSKYTEAWADYPIPIVLKLVEQGQLSGLEALVKETSSKTSPVTAIEDQILKSDMFTQEEKDQYRKLMTIQHAVAKAEEI
jgi:capsid portal protein